MTVGELLRALDRVPGLTRSHRRQRSGARCAVRWRHTRPVAPDAARIRGAGRDEGEWRGVRAAGHCGRRRGGCRGVATACRRHGAVDRRQRRTSRAGVALGGILLQHPSREMRVVGITGTNGKTTTSFLVSAILDAAGVQCGLMGTVTYRIGDRAFDATRTTPEAPDLQAFMRDMVAAAARASWRCRRMRWRSDVWTASHSPRRSSPISRVITSTSTSTWRTTSPRSAGCSRCSRRRASADQRGRSARCVAPGRAASGLIRHQRRPTCRLVRCRIRCAASIS